jgi:hypothetical protein
MVTRDGRTGKHARPRPWRQHTCALTLTLARMQARTRTRYIHVRTHASSRTYMRTRRVCALTRDCASSLCALLWHAAAVRTERVTAKTSCGQGTDRTVLAGTVRLWVLTRECTRCSFAVSCRLHVCTESDQLHRRAGAQTGLVFSGAYQCGSGAATAARLTVNTWPSAAQMAFVPATTRCPLRARCPLFALYTRILCILWAAAPASTP